MLQQKVPSYNQLKQEILRHDSAAHTHTSAAAAHHGFTLPHLTIEQLAMYGLSVVGALIILIVGWTIANLVSRWIKKWMGSRKRFDATLTPIIADTVKIVIIGVTIIMVLKRFGIQTASLIALIGSIGIGVGLALQGTLSDIAAGMMLLSLRPFNAGDAVDLNGTVGVIDEIGLFVTEMHTYDGVYMTLPNSKVWGNQIQNYYRNETRRIDLTIRIHRDSNIDKAMSIITEIAQSDERVLKEPELLVAVRELNESSIDILVRPWTAPGDWWRTQLDMKKRIKERFDEEGIIIPFPQRDIHLPENGNGASQENKEATKELS
jgi:small conductance mechanosensitive channel